MCLHMCALVNGVNKENKCRTLITCAFYLSRCLSSWVYSASLSLRLCLLPHAVIQCVTIQTPHSVTVAVLTGSLDCLVIQLKQWDPKNPRHISIMLLTECRDATLPGNIRTTPRVICMSITSENHGSRHEARRANLKLCCTSNIPRPPTLTPTYNRQHTRIAAETGEQSILGDRK